jgi:phosphatidylglycerophosphate synthase
MSGQVAAERARYTARQMLARNRGGGLFSEAVSQRVGAVLAAASGNRGVHPTVLTAGSLAFGVATAVVVILTARAGAWWPGVVAIVGWQFAYALDCADGQLARVSGQTSEHGARVDVLADFAVQTGLCAAVTAVAYAHSRQPVAVSVAFGMLWVLNLFTAVLAKSDPDRTHSLVRSTSLPVRAVKLIRDPGLLLLVVGLLVLIVPYAMIWFVWAMLVLNGLFLLASIANEARRSMAAPGS